MIKAIETEYNGYRFRSRLEARWAVFFDIIEVEWEYEKEGFDLGDAGWYLPDFFLPKYSVWFEIKGVTFTPLEKWKCQRLAEGTRQPVGMLSGVPDQGFYECWVPIMRGPKDVQVYECELWDFAFTVQTLSDGLRLERLRLCDDSEPVNYLAVLGITPISYSHKLDAYADQVKRYQSLVYELAVRSARSARFEHRAKA